MAGYRFFVIRDRDGSLRTIVTRKKRLVLPDGSQARDYVVPAIEQAIAKRKEPHDKALADRACRALELARSLSYPNRARAFVRAEEPVR